MIYREEEREKNLSTIRIKVTRVTFFPFLIENKFLDQSVRNLYDSTVVPANF